MEVEEGALSRFLLSKEDSQPHRYLVLLLVGVFLEFFFSLNITKRHPAFLCALGEK